jgi:hypothetical protein
VGLRLILPLIRGFSFVVITSRKVHGGENIYRALLLENAEHDRNPPNELIHERAFTLSDHSSFSAYLGG